LRWLSAVFVEGLYGVEEVVAGGRLGELVLL